MNETFLKTFLRMGVMIALRIPLRLAGGWLLAKGVVSAGEWETFGSGVMLVGVDVAWYWFERRGVLQALSQQEAIITQQQSRLLDQVAELDRRRDLVNIALRLPKGATMQDALEIQANMKSEAQ